MRNSLLPFLSAIIYFLYNVVFTNYLFITSIGLTFTLYIFFDFIYKIGKIFPIKEFIVLIASLQWIVGAKISYNIGKAHYKYYMYVDEETYMTYVIPGLIALFIGMNLIRTKVDFEGLQKVFNQNRMALKRTSFFLIAIGLFSTFIAGQFSISGLAFFLYLASLSLYIGIAHLFFLYPNRKWQLFFATLGTVFIISIKAGLFHDLLLIGAFLTFFLIPDKSKFLSKIIFFSIGASLIYMIQVVKQDYRNIVWEGANSSKDGRVALFYDLVEQKFFAPPASQTNYISLNQKTENEETSEINTRLNQGWIISKILEHIPTKRDYLEGSTIGEAISSSILPRFLFPDKKGADAALENFQIITGLHLEKGTSMGLSIIGEFYANYGVYGGWVAMLLYGVFIGLLIRFLIHSLGNGSPIMLFWFILIFYQVVKAETDFIKIINHIFKSVIFFIIIKVMFKQLNFKLLPKFDSNED